MKERVKEKLNIIVNVWNDFIWENIYYRNPLLSEKSNEKLRKCPGSFFQPQLAPTGARLRRVPT